MAALRSGMTTVIIPADNAKDLEEIDQTVRAGLTFLAVETVDEVLSAALAVDLSHSEQPVTPQANALQEKGGLNLRQ